MKKFAVIVLAVVIACFTLVSCGGSNYVGKWELEEMSSTGMTLKDNFLGIPVAIMFQFEFKEDGTGALVLFGESMDGKWEAKSATDATFTYEGQTINMKITDGKLTMEQNGSKLTFVKGTASSASASAASASAASASASAASASAASASGSSSSAS